MILLHTYKGKDIKVEMLPAKPFPVAICPICREAIPDAAFIQQHLDWHSERLGS